VDLVDMPNADAQEILQEWFGKIVDEDKIMQSLPPPLQKVFQNNPRTRAAILEPYRAMQIGEGGVPELPRESQEELANYSGALSAQYRTMDDLSDQVRETVVNEFGVRVSLLDGLAIVCATYGHLVGGTTPEDAILQVFPMGGVRYAVLAQRLPTEALLFELVPEKTITWLHQRGLADKLQDLDALRKHLIGCTPDDPILNQLSCLVHTAAHALRRSSERYTGMGRDLTDELLFPRALAFAVYCNRGSEMGMFATTFGGRLLEWMCGARYDVSNCPFDPICMHEAHAACPGCLHVAERGCTTLWNRNLDRRCLVQLPSSKVPGYWS
jgi:hypothetical protein